MNTIRTPVTTEPGVLVSLTMSSLRRRVGPRGTTCIQSSAVPAHSGGHLQGRQTGEDAWGAGG